ncbi:ABC transporter ATP-binding protein [Polaromonas aquatica]|uniref:ABC transporter ATP-binding protein n=1 Tax=Polaromonas aquatica TaxID=332657 RepID=UPI003D64E5F3
MVPNIDIDGLTKVFSKGNSLGSDLTAMFRALLPGEGKVAVDNLSLTIRQGERLGIVGRNGAGKSTLLHLVAGLSTPSSGRITSTGKITSILTLGVGLREDLTGRENIYIDAEIQGKAKSAVDLAINEIIEFADLGEFIDYPIRTYSTGMKARLAFSMIAHVDPEILIIDEALSVGDAAFSVKATQRIRDICARGKIVIIVSHSMQAIESICNRCIWMDAGRVVMDGHPGDVTRAYIDAVKAEDEAQLVAKFRSLIGTRSHRDGWLIRSVTCHVGDEVSARSLLEVGSPARFAVSGGVPVDVVNATIQIRMVRLDGVVVFDEAFELRDHLQLDGVLRLEIGMTPLVLGIGIYRLDVVLTDGGATRAESTSIFEVRSERVPAGGKPMLLYPIAVNCENS